MPWPGLLLLLTLASSYPDMLEVGQMENGFVEDRTHFGMWVITSSPLILGLDLNDTAKVDSVWSVISNRELIAINSAWHGHPGRILANYTHQGSLVQVWGKPQGGGKWAVLVFNAAQDMGSRNLTSIKIDFADVLGMPAETTAAVRCVYERKDLGSFKGSFAVDPLSPHDSRLLLITPSASSSKLRPKTMEPAAAITLPTSFAPAAPVAQSAPPSCEARCLQAGHCCTGNTCPDSHPSCAMGCTMAAASASLNKCYQQCKEADDSCSFAVGNQTLNMCGSACPKPTAAAGDGATSLLPHHHHQQQQQQQQQRQPQQCVCPKGWGCDSGTSLEGCFQGCIFHFGCAALPPPPTTIH